MALSKNLGVGVNFRPCSEGHFLSECPQFVVLDGFNSFWSGPNQKNQSNLYLTKMTWTRPKQFVSIQNNLDGPKLFWTYRTGHQVFALANKYLFTFLWSPESQKTVFAVRAQQILVRMMRHSNDIFVMKWKCPLQFSGCCTKAIQNEIFLRIFFVDIPKQKQ